MFQTETRESYRPHQLSTEPRELCLLERGQKIICELLNIYDEWNK